jgi:hypothetical protein
VSNRSIEFADLERLSTKDQLQVNPYLDSISSGWEMKKQKGAFVYTNNLKDEVLIFIAKGELTLQSNKVAIAQEFIPMAKVVKQSTETSTSKVDNGLDIMKIFELENATVKHLVHKIDQVSQPEFAVWYKRK